MKKKDPNFPSSQQVVCLAAELSLILRESYGERSSAIKRIAVELEISERTVKNWYSGRNGPRGDHLISLMKTNEKVFILVLKLTGRPSVASIDHLLVACGHLDQARDSLMKVRTLQV